MPKRIFTDSDKVKIVLASLGDNIVVKDFCTKHGVARSSLYAWRKALLTALSTQLLAARLKRQGRLA